MSKARARRNCIRWARYINHYGHIPSVSIGGWGAVRAMSHGRTATEYFHVRSQQKRPYATGYPND